jgi:hypothetical protein
MFRNTIVLITQTSDWSMIAAPRNSLPPLPTPEHDFWTGYGVFSVADRLISGAWVAKISAVLSLR